MQATNWAAHKLPSGKPFSDVFAGTIGWLKHENYIVSFGSLPTEGVLLTEKGLAALNAVPKGLSATLGSSLVQATSETGRKDWSPVGDMIGGFAKSMGGS